MEAGEVASRGGGEEVKKILRDLLEERRHVAFMEGHKGLGGGVTSLSLAFGQI